MNKAKLIVGTVLLGLYLLGLYVFYNQNRYEVICPSNEDLFFDMVLVDKNTGEVWRWNMYLMRSQWVPFLEPPN